MCCTLNYSGLFQIFCFFFLHCISSMGVIPLIWIQTFIGRTNLQESVIRPGSYLCTTSEATKIIKLSPIGRLMVPVDLVLCLKLSKGWSGFPLMLLLFVYWGVEGFFSHLGPDWIVVSLNMVWLCLLQIKWKNFKNFLRQFDGRFYQFGQDVVCRSNLN